MNLIKKSTLIGVCLIAGFSFANTQNQLSNNGQDLLKSLSAPENKNDKLNDIDNIEDTELTMAILQSVEQKQLNNKDSKIEYVKTLTTFNSNKVPNKIKEGVIRLIKQDITYSDHEKIKDGVYLLKCDKLKLSGRPVLDYRPNRGCVYERSNICEV